MSIYPNAIDGFEQIPLVVDGVTKVNAASVNVLREAILQIEIELGINPSGSFDDVASRLDDFETRILEIEDIIDSLVISGGVIPTGTGFTHITSGIQDVAAKLVENADVSVSAAIIESKLLLNFPTHSNVNDPTASEKAALGGSSGTPSVSNPYVTTEDPRLDEFTTIQDGLVPAPGSSTGLFLQDDGTWAEPSGAGDVTGPASSTDNAVARFDLTTGKIIQNSVVTIADSTGNIAGVGTLNTHTIPGGTGTIALISDIPAAYTDEQAQDAVGTILTGTTTIDFTYSDATPSITADVKSNSISNTLLAQVSTQTFKGRTTALTGNVEDLTATQATAILNAFVGDSGSGGTKGLVPAPASGDAAANKFLKADGTWAEPSGTGDVTGPASSTDNAIARFDLTTGKIIQDSVITIADSTGDMAGVGTLNTHTIPGGTGTIALTSDLTNLVTGPASATDNAIARFDLTTGKIIQNSVVTIADSTGDMAGVGTLNTHTIPGGTGTIALTSDIPAAYTDEQAQDAVGIILTGTTTIDFTYSDGTPSITADVKSNSISNSLLAQVATQTFKGRTTALTGNVEDLTATQATAILNAFVGDSGSGGTKGLVPAPASGDAAANKFLKADGTWQVVVSGGSGDRTTYVYQPGGTPDTANGLYDDFGDLYTDALAVAAENNLVTIIIDDSITSPAVIPDGTYDLKYITLVGMQAYQEANATGTHTQISTGNVIFNNWTTGISYARLTHTGSNPLSEFTTSLLNSFYLGTQAFYAANLAPIWFSEDLGGGERDILMFAGSGVFFENDGFEVLEVEDPNQIFIRAGIDFNLDSSTFRGNGNINISRAAINGSFNTTQPNYSGVLSISNFDPDYTPADVGDWANVPTLMSEALDELADVVAGLSVGGGGDVTGPASATDNAVARFDLTTGKIIQDSVVTIADSTGDMAGVGTLNTHTIPGGTGTIALTSDIATTNARVAVKKAGSTVGTRRGINFIDGTNITVTVIDDSGNEEVDVTITAASSISVGKVIAISSGNLFI